MVAAPAAVSEASLAVAEPVPAEAVAAEQPHAVAVQVPSPAALAEEAAEVNEPNTAAAPGAAAIEPAADVETPIATDHEAPDTHGAAVSLLSAVPAALAANGAEASHHEAQVERAALARRRRRAAAAKRTASPSKRAKSAIDPKGEN